MKKLMKSLMLFAAAAMALTSCENEVINEGIATNDTHTMTFVAGAPESKTWVEIDGEDAYYWWYTEGETFEVLENTIKDGKPTLAKATSVVADTEAEDVATITATFKDVDADEYSYAVIYPKKNYVDGTDFTSAKLIFPTQQTMATGSYDPDADLLISKAVNVRPNAATNIEFKRLNAVGRMHVKGLATVGTETITRVEFATAKTTLTGRAYVDLATGKVTEYGYSNMKYNNVVVNCEIKATAASTTMIYFTTMPASLKSGETYTITVTTDKATYTKQGTIGDKALEFTAGNVTGFTANMATATREAIDNYEGNFVIVAKRATGNYFYLAPTNKVNATRLDAIDTQASTLEMIDNTVEEYIWTIEKDGLHYTIMSADGKYISAYTDGNNARVDAAVSENTKMSIIESGDCVNIQSVAYNNRFLEFNSDVQYQYFAFYKGTQIKNLYLIPAVVDERTKQNLSFGTTTEFTIKEGETFNAPELSGAATTVTYSSSNPAVATVDASTGAVTIVGGLGTTTITATAAENDEYRKGAASYTLTVAPKTIEKLTIAEFLKKEVNADIYYELTGVIANIANTSYGNFNLEDATGTVYVYGLTDKKVTSNNQSFSKLGLVAGDVVTIQGTRAVYNSSAQVGGPAYYISHYGVTATPSGTSVEAEGGDITITIATKNPVEGQAVTVAISDNDFATLTYDGGNTATISFDKNSGDKARSVSVTISYGMAKQVVDLSQKSESNTTVAADITIPFKKANMTTKVSSYTSTWKYTYEGTTLSIANFNNNNAGWDYIKCGRKNNASVANISTTQAIDALVSKVVVSVSNVTTANVKSTYLQVASDANFSNIIETVNATIKTGDVEYKVTNPAAGLYYRVVFDCKSASSNGIVTVTKIAYK